jgi:hypothetical protein
MAAALEHSGQPNRAKRSIQDGLDLVGLNGLPLLVTLSRVHSLTGEQDRAFEVLEEIERRTSDPLLLSHVHARVGNRQLAMELLRQGADQRHYRISDVNTLPSFAPFRDDRGFMLLMRKVGVGTDS